MELLQLMNCGLRSINLTHNDVLFPIAMLDDSTFTEDGKKAWADILSAEVISIDGNTHNGVLIELSGCSSERLASFARLLAEQCSQKDCEKWLKSSIDRVKPWLTTRGINLIATYEEIHEVPCNQCLTRYFPNYGCYYKNYEATEEQLQEAYNKALASIDLDSDTFMNKDNSFSYRGDIINRMRDCLLYTELKPGDPVIFVPTEPLVGAKGFRIGGGRVATIAQEEDRSKICIVTGEEVHGEMRLPLHFVLAKYNPEYPVKNFGISCTQPLYKADNNYANSLLRQAEDDWEANMEHSIQQM